MESGILTNDTISSSVNLLRSFASGSSMSEYISPISRL